MRVILIIFLYLLGLFEIGAILIGTSPPSDEEIRDSFVDSWTPTAMLTSLVLRVLVVIVVLILTAWYVSPKSRKLSVVVLIVSIGVGLHWLINHIHLSERAASAWGINLGGFYGLF